MVLEDLNKRKYKTDGIVDSNLLVLYQRIKVIEAHWIDAGNQPFEVTSGLRDSAQQASLIKAGKTKATKSKHLLGLAADIYDPENKIKKWLLENPKLLEENDLWCEHYDHTFGWVHFQCVPPGSGNRWFIP